MRLVSKNPATPAGEFLRVRLSATGPSSFPTSWIGTRLPGREPTNIAPVPRQANSSILLHREAVYLFLKLATPRTVLAIYFAMRDDGRFAPLGFMIALRFALIYEI